MIHLKSFSQQRELRSSIKRLILNLDQSSENRKDNIADSGESIASYVSRLNDESLNRSFLDYCSSARNYSKLKKK
ncbi:hypothetical protein [Ekhidna sp. To15]|uniref:hypothetical protein n=1 Tax=Ekhidna sp. To15 TaxID=3395267 RepID=UPI003F522819